MTQINHKKGHAFLPLIALIILFNTGCGDDPFSQISNIEIPSHEAQTVISAHFIAGDTLLRTGLDKSRSITGDNHEVSNGTIRAFSNDEDLASWTFKTDSSLFTGEAILATSLSAMPGVRYRLEGQVEGLPIASAEQIMPMPPPVQQLEYEYQGALNPDGDEVSEVRIKFDRSQITTESYYGFRIFEPNPFGSCRQVTQDSVDCTSDTTLSVRFLDTPDPLLVAGGDAFLLLSSDDLPSDNYEVIIQFFENTGSAPHILEVLSLTEDGYRYLRSYRAFEDARFDPFSEPVNVHDNIDNGYGYFMVSNRRNFRLQR